MNRRHILIALATLALTTAGVGVAWADDFAPPPWERWRPTQNQTNQYAIFAEWEFSQDTNPVGPGNEAEIDLNPLHCMLCANEVEFPTQAQWQAGDGDGEFLFTATGQAFGQLTNVIDELPTKLLRAQITYRDPQMTGQIPDFLVISAFDPTVPGSIPVDGGSIVRVGSTSFGVIDDQGTTDLSDDAYGYLFEWRIHPNPNNESFRIDVPAGLAIDQLIIDTVSVPEPGTMCLLVLATMGMGAAIRRRQRAA